MLGRLHYLACLIALIPAMLRWRMLLHRHRDALAKADAVVVMSSPRAFGTLFVTLDETRRLFAGKRIVFFYHLEPVGHNPLLGKAFSDVYVVHQPRRRLDIALSGKRLELPPDDWHDPMSFWMTQRWVRRHGLAEAEVVNAFQIWRRLPVSAEASPHMPKVHEKPVDQSRSPFKSYGKIDTGWVPGEANVMNELHMYGGWNTLRTKVEAPPMRLPDEIKRPISSALLAARNGRPAKLCGFHTRYGGNHDKTHRDGSPLEFYIPAIRALVDAGYQVLMQGDRTFHPRFRETFDGMVVDARSLGVDKNAFRLFCGCHTDLFVGDWPVAPQMASANGIPTLVVNAWPVGWGVNGAQVYYRGIRDDDGEIWDAIRTLRYGPFINCNTVPHDYPELYEYSGVPMADVVECKQAALSEEEILAAVCCFLEDIATGAPETELQREAAQLLPPWSPFAMAAGARLNRAWLARVKADLTDRIPAEALESERINA